MKMRTCASGWNCAVKNGFVSCMMPSLVLSLALVNNVFHPGGRVASLTAYPLFCESMGEGSAGRRSGYQLARRGCMGGAAVGIGAHGTWGVM